MTTDWSALVVLPISVLPTENGLHMVSWAFMFCNRDVHVCKDGLQ